MCTDSPKYMHPIFPDSPKYMHPIFPDSPAFFCDLTKAQPRAPSSYFSPPMFYVDPSKLHVLSHVVETDLGLNSRKEKEGKTRHIAAAQDGQLVVPLFSPTRHFSKYTTSDPECLRDTQATVRWFVTSPLMDSFQTQTPIVDKWNELRDQRPMFHVHCENDRMDQMVTSVHKNPWLLLLFTFIYLAAGIPLMLKQLVSVVTRTMSQERIWGPNWIHLVALGAYCIWGIVSKVLSVYKYAKERSYEIQRLHDIYTGLKHDTDRLELLSIGVSTTLESAAHKQFWKELHHHIHVVKTEFLAVCDYGLIPKPTSALVSKVVRDGDLRSVCFTLRRSNTLHPSVMFVIGAADYFRHLRYVSSIMNPADIGADEKVPRIARSNGTEAKVEDKADTGTEQTETKETARVTHRPVLVDQVHPYLLLQQQQTPPVPNTIDMADNLVITGPNAAGKTTVLKSTLINLIYTQQYGYGFYDECKMPYLYDTFHSYLNIPIDARKGDHSRDSLFESEARQCLSILDSVRESNKHTANAHHFCIFDELFSGTNPTDAVATSAAFLTYLTANHPEVDFLMTTHYTDMCKLVHRPESSASKKIGLQMMVSTVTASDKIVPSYKLMPGVSSVYGAVSVLRNMNYPNQICETAKKYICDETAR